MGLLTISGEERGVEYEYILRLYLFEGGLYVLVCLGTCLSFISCGVKDLIEDIRGRRK
jgi:hypothetical protein